MKLRITAYAIGNWVESVDLNMSKASLVKRETVMDDVLEETGRLVHSPNDGQVEIWMEDREHVYRRLVVGHFKVIYRVEDDLIYVTDIFDSRQDHTRMRG